MKDYKIVFGHNTEDLTKSVNDALKEGWSCLGNPFVIQFESWNNSNKENELSFTLHQAMVK